MAVKTIIPKSGKLYWADIRDTLNANGGSVVDSDLASAFDARGNINYKAKFKPVKWSDIFRSSSDNWWKATNGNCGVKVPIYTSSASLRGVSDAATLWSHDYPTGGTSQVFNQQDFRGYNPKAEMVEGASVNPDTDVLINTEAGWKSVCAIRFSDNTGDDADALDYTYIQTQSGKMSLDDWYFGVIAITTSGNTYCAATMPYTMTELNSISTGDYAEQDDHYAYLNLNNGMFPYTGEYDVYPAFFYDKLTASEVEGNPSTFANGYIPLPVKPIRVNVISLSDLYEAAITSVSLSDTDLTIYYTVTSKSGKLVFGPTNNTPILEVRGYTDIAVGKELFPHSGNSFADVIKSYEVPSGQTISCDDTVGILSPYDDSGNRYKYISVAIRWPTLNMSAVLSDIEI